MPKKLASVEYFLGLGVFPSLILGGGGSGGRGGSVSLRNIGVSSPLNVQQNSPVKPSGPEVWEILMTDSVC